VTALSAKFVAHVGQSRRVRAPSDGVDADHLAQRRAEAAGDCGGGPAGGRHALGGYLVEEPIDRSGVRGHRPGRFVRRY
jgi:hypothetical protein